MVRTLTILSLFAMTSTASAADYNIDAGHSRVVFKIKHLGVANFWGAFHHVGGTLSYDKANPAASKINVEVKTDSIFTADKKRDQRASV